MRGTALRFEAILGEKGLTAGVYFLITDYTDYAEKVKRGGGIYDFLFSIDDLLLGINPNPSKPQRARKHREFLDRIDRICFGQWGVLDTASCSKLGLCAGAGVSSTADFVGLRINLLLAELELTIDYLLLGIKVRGNLPLKRGDFGGEL